MSAWTDFRDRQISRLKANAIARVKSVRVESEYGPTIDIRDPLIPGPPNPYLQALKPKITIDIEGMDPIVMAPYGFPGPTKWEGIKTGAQVGGSALGLGLAFLVYKAFKG